ncbi:MAG: hypothetical protein ACFFE8_10860 [Candidatus Heimdallarchaeota archaeon]
MTLSNRLGIFITACLSLGLAGYVFVFGALMLSGVVDIYYVYSLSAIFRPVNLEPIPIILSLLQTALVAAIFLIITYYLLKPVWNEILLKFLITLRIRASPSSSPPSPDISGFESTEKMEKPRPQTSSSTSSLLSFSENWQEILGGLVTLSIAVFLGIRIYNVYFTDAPSDLGYLITAYPLPLRLPILVIIMLGAVLWLSAIYLLKEALKDIRWLEKTQLAHQFNHNKENEN